MKILKHEQHVKFCLKNFPRLRDNDTRLYANVIALVFEKKGENLSHYTATDLLQIFKESWFPKAESITRCRRKLQELHPELRGTKYVERQLQQKNVKNEMKYGHTAFNG